jgi:biopolymer transport protein ExbD
MAKQPQVQEEVVCNLIPMVDIMFLLLLFFMLGADMGHRELEEVLLPKAYSVKEEKEQGGTRDDRLVVNVYHLYPNEVNCPAYKNGQVCREKKHWRIGIQGRDYADLKKLELKLKTEGDPFRAEAMTSLSTGKQVPFSERVIMVRGDASSPYGYVQEVINACAKVGIYKIEVGAARPPDADLAAVRTRSSPGG